MEMENAKKVLIIDAGKLNNLVYVANAKYNKFKTGRIIDYNIHIRRTDEGKVYAEATDGCCLLRYDIKPDDAFIEAFGNDLIINVKGLKKFTGIWVSLYKIDSQYIFIDLEGKKQLVDMIEGIYPNTNAIIPNTKELCSCYAEQKPEYIKLKNDIFNNTGIPFQSAPLQPLLWNDANTSETGIVFVVMPIKLQRY